MSGSAARGDLPRDITLAIFDRLVIQPTLSLLPEAMQGPRPTAMLLAIGLQESALAARFQRNGPARGYWQFERAGGCADVLDDPDVAGHTQRLCRLFHVNPTTTDLHTAIAYHDLLACAAARLLLYLDPAPMPGGDTDGAMDGWGIYLRRWRPGKPHPSTWLPCFDAAWDYVRSTMSDEADTDTDGRQLT